MSYRHLRDTRPTARKEYRCFLCGIPIAVGTKQPRQSGARDGGLDSFRMHELCESKAAKWSIDDWECFSEGEQPEFRMYELTAEERASLEATQVGAKA